MDMTNKGMFSSNTDEWATPQDFFDNVNKEFNFEVDVCALPDNAKCKIFFPLKKMDCSKIGGGIQVYG